MDEEDVKRIVQREEGDVEKIEELSGGAVHHIYSVTVSDGDEFVFKGVGSRWHDLPAFERGYRVEPLILNYLSKKDFPAPEVRFYNFSKETSDFRYLAMEKLKGKNMREIEEREKLMALVEDVGSRLAELHGFISFENGGKLVSSGGLEARKFEWREMYRSQVYTYTIHMLDRRYHHCREKIERLVENNADILKPEKFTIVHQEFGPRNILVKDDGISGVVDWERSISGDPGFEAVRARENLVQHAKELGLNDARPRIQEKLEGGYGEDIISRMPERKEALYRLAYIAHMMWSTRHEDPEKRRLEEQLSEVEERLEG